MQRDDPRGWLVTGGFPGGGSQWNGLPVDPTRVDLATPSVFQGERFPEMPEAEFNAVFNRYAHIRLAAINAPYNPLPDMVVVPESRFRAVLEPSGAGW